MRTLIAVVIVLVICATGVGFYRGWFALSSEKPVAGSKEVNVNLKVDVDKMQDDADTVQNKTEELTRSVTKSATEPADQTADEVPAKEASPDDGQPEGAARSAEKPNGD